MIKYARDSRIKRIILSTNATLLDQKSQKLLLRNEFAPDVLQFSVEGDSPASYEKYREGAKFSDVYKKIRQFYRLKSEKKGKSKPKLQIHLLINKKTDLKAFVNLWGKYCEFVNAGIMEPPRFFETPDELRNELYEPSNIYWGCLQPFHTITIGYDGKVSICCGDFDFKLEVGDLKKETLLKIWRNKKYTDLRNKLWSGKFEESICSGCFSVYYGGINPILKSAQSKINKLMIK